MTENESQQLAKLRESKDWRKVSYEAALFYCANVSFTAQRGTMSTEEAMAQYSIMLEMFINEVGTSKCVSSLFSLILGFVSFEDVLDYIKEYEAERNNT